MPALESLKGNTDALYVVTDALVNTNRVRINTLALDARLPTMHGEKGYVEFDGLMSYGPNFPDMWSPRAFGSPATIFWLPCQHISSHTPPSSTGCPSARSNIQSQFHERS